MLKNNFKIGDIVETNVGIGVILSEKNSFLEMNIYVNQKILFGYDSSLKSLDDTIISNPKYKIYIPSYQIKSIFNS